MNSKNTFTVNKQAVANSFSKAAQRYDQFAQLQRDIGSQLLTSISSVTGDKVLDLGCGTGYFSAKLCEIYPHCRLTCFDLSEAMLAQVDKKRLTQVSSLQGDIDSLPFAENSFDLIFSNLVMQWSADLGCCLRQLKASLKESGKLYFSTLLDGSLDELTQAWKNVDQHPHTNSFLKLETIKQQLQECGFAKLAIKTEARILHYDNVIEVMRALKGIGANHVHGQQALTTKGRKLLNLLEQGYAPFVNEQGQLNLTYQICYVEAVK
ncbi:MAG: malonyl-ACP O-methyltransferase BioC [Psychromonas sp.]|nr:malonyl-ACP O-methyltransferase BioC [Psychromonas sp.]